MNEGENEVKRNVTNKGHLVDLGVVELLELSEHGNILGGNEVDRDSLSTESSSSSDPVDVVLPEK